MKPKNLFKVTIFQQTVLLTIPIAMQLIYSKQKKISIAASLMRQEEIIMAYIEVKNARIYI